MMPRVRRALVLTDTSTHAIESPDVTVRLGPPQITATQIHGGNIVQTTLSPASFHLLDHEYGQTPQHQIIRQPAAPPPRTEVSLSYAYVVCIDFITLIYCD